MKSQVLSAYAWGQFRLQALRLLVLGCGVLALLVNFTQQLLMGVLGRRSAMLDPSFS
jgi:hypothetical protein